MPESSSTLIDTDILIDVSRGVNHAIDYIEILSKKSLLAISTITKMELIVGCRNKDELKNLDKFLKHFQINHINERISKIGIDLLSKYRLSHGLLIPDALIAATALAEELPFATKNVRDYQFVEGLNLLSYPK